jgi:hypothetical protein
VPTTLPTPPVSAVPPTTTAATEVSMNWLPMPRLGEPM